jgi:hypothetical protein
VLWYKRRICVLKNKKIKNLVLREAHSSIHPRGNKMYQYLKLYYWWYGTNHDITEYTALCDTYQRVKIEHQRPARLLQPLKVPEWKWEEIGMDFIVGLPRTQKSYDSIWVIVHRLTKVAKFILVNMMYIGP